MKLGSPTIHDADDMRAAVKKYDNHTEMALFPATQWYYAAEVYLTFRGPRAFDKATRLAAAINAILSEPDDAQANAQAAE